MARLLAILLLTGAPELPAPDVAYVREVLGDRQTDRITLATTAEAFRIDPYERVRKGDRIGPYRIVRRTGPLPPAILAAARNAVLSPESYWVRSICRHSDDGRRTQCRGRGSYCTWEPRHAVRFSGADPGGGSWHVDVVVCLTCGELGPVVRASELRATDRSDGVKQPTAMLSPEGESRWKSIFGELPALKDAPGDR